jgi:hypothetical protein
MLTATPDEIVALFGARWQEVGAYMRMEAALQLIANYGHGKYCWQKGEEHGAPDPEECGCLTFIEQPKEIARIALASLSDEHNPRIGGI